LRILWTTAQVFLADAHFSILPSNPTTEIPFYVSELDRHSASGRISSHQ